MAVTVIPKQDFQMQSKKTPKKMQFNLNIQLTSYADNPNCSQVDKTMHENIFWHCPKPKDGVTSITMFVFVN